MKWSLIFKVEIDPLAFIPITSSQLRLLKKFLSLDTKHTILAFGMKIKYPQYLNKTQLSYRKHSLP